MNTEVKIIVPEGMEIDCIKFKPIEPKRWRDDKNAVMSGYYINLEARINVTGDARNCAVNHNIFATKKQAKSALAMARISQIMANDKRFGGAITDAEWRDKTTYKYCVERQLSGLSVSCYSTYYCFLAFHTREQCNLFLEENEDLVKDYLMMD